MLVTAYKIRPLTPPQDSLISAIRASKLQIHEGDIVVVSSKVVSIGEGRCVPFGAAKKETLVRREAEWYLKPVKSAYRRLFTIAGGSFVGSAGIDESNGNDHYILYPKNPEKSARTLHAWFKKEYNVKKLGFIIADSMSIPLRRGAIGFALSCAGFAPLKDYRGQKDIFGRIFKFEVANIADALATTAVLLMGEGNEQTPIVVIRDAPVSFGKISTKKTGTLAVHPEDDIFAPLFFGKGWKKGGT